MGYSFACADAGAPCPGSFATETKDELLQHLQMHTATAHPDMPNTPEAAAQVGSLIKQF
jgi:predicted small metal-binding protein